MPESINDRVNELEKWRRGIEQWQKSCSEWQSNVPQWIGGMDEWRDAHKKKHEQSDVRRWHERHSLVGWVVMPLISAAITFAISRILA